jgi:hypothetical protein
MDEQNHSQKQEKKVMTDAEVLAAAKNHVGGFFGRFKGLILGKSKWETYFRILVLFNILVGILLGLAILSMLNPVMGIYFAIIFTTYLPSLFFLWLSVHFLAVLIYLIFGKPKKKPLIISLVSFVVMAAILSLLNPLATVKGLVENVTMPVGAHITETQAIQLISDCRVGDVNTIIPNETTLYYVSLGNSFPPSKTAYLPNSLHKNLEKAIADAEPRCVDKRKANAGYRNDQLSKDEASAMLRNCEFDAFSYFYSQYENAIIYTRHNAKSTLSVRGTDKVDLLNTAYEAQSVCKDLEVKSL